MARRGRPDAALWLVGENRAGIRSSARYLDAHFGSFEVIDKARHCALYEAREPRLQRPFELADYLTAWSLRMDGEDLKLLSLPGVFAHGRLDRGSELLLNSLWQLRPAGRLLDFACGYGLLLRFLTHSLPVDNITASEIQPEALAFVRDRFGVRAILSNVDPQAFQPGATFDIIWVASLFSHLPERLFERWLGRLTRCLTPQGILCFSAHDDRLLPAGTTMPESGIHYRPFSENPDLDGRNYGTTFVTEDYVRRSMGTACGRDRNVFLIPRGLAHEQDLYVVAGEANTDLDALSGFRHGPWGWVDERVMRPSGELYLRGWAASLDDGALEAVKITVDGQRFDARKMPIAERSHRPQLDTGRA